MTLVLFTYEDNNNNIATIEQEKYCSSYQLVVFDRKNRTTELNRTYLSVKTAKQALKKYFPDMKKID